MKEGWQMIKIGDVCEVIAGQSPEGKYYNSDGKGMPFYQGKKDFGDKSIKKPTTWTTQSKKIARKGDILMSVRAPVGPVNFTTGEICIGRGLAAIRTKDELNRNFLFYQLLHKQPEIAGREGAVFASINKSEIEALTIAFANLPEQERIVRILDEAFEGIAKVKTHTEKNLRNARALFESYLESVFSQRGEGWQTKTIGDVAEVIAGQSPEGSFYNNSGDGLPFYQGKKEFRERFIGPPKTWTSRSTKIAVEGDVLMSVRAPVGPVNFATETSCIGRGLAAIRNGATLDKNFLFYFLLSKQDEINGNEGAVFASINKAEIQNITIPLPSLTEQCTIVSKLGAMQPETQRLENINQRKLAALEELKKSLLGKAFSGEL